MSKTTIALRAKLRTTALRHLERLNPVVAIDTEQLLALLDDIEHPEPMRCRCGMEAPFTCIHELGSTNWSIGPLGVWCPDCVVAIANARRNQ